jgi:hypothetical protein
MPWTDELWEYQLYKNGIKSGKTGVIFGEPKGGKTLIHRLTYISTNTDTNAILPPYSVSTVNAPGMIQWKNKGSHIVG